MKATIDGVRYNTEKDTMIATNQPQEDELPSFSDTEIHLYRTMFNKYYVHMIYSVKMKEETILPVDAQRAKVFFDLMVYHKLKESSAFHFETKWRSA